MAARNRPARVFAAAAACQEPADEDTDHEADHVTVSHPETTAAADITAPFVVIDRRHHMTLTRKPFAEFAVELAAGLRAGRGDEPIGRERQVQGDRGGAPF